MKSEPLLANAMDVLGAVWGFDALRPIQAAAISAALAGQDCVAVLPTGGGKSLCYQLPPLVTGETTIVVSPLISLMKDQVDALRLLRVSAAGLHSGMSERERDEVMAEFAAGRLRLLYIAPERLLSSGFLGQAAALPFVTRVAIDEAHCVSHWGHDFRPEYRALAAVRERLPRVSVAAMTATATPRVREDIASQLRLRAPVVLVGDVDRANLTYRVMRRTTGDGQMVRVLMRHADEASIVYCISRKETERIAGVLSDRGIEAKAYHAGLTARARTRVQEAFCRERLNVVVATVAFGMGIDRSDVRCVLHAGLPKSIEAYQQETGRAGRDGLGAECVLLFGAGDVMKWTRLIERSNVEAGVDRAVTEAAIEQVAAMGRFAASGRCRHALLCEHFGQAYALDRCGACDVCLGERSVEPDSTVTAQKILSCVARCERASGVSFGAAYIADVLRGSRAAGVLERGHDRLSTHGVLAGLSKAEIVGHMQQLVEQGLLSRTDGDVPCVTLCEDSWAVLRGVRAVTLVSESSQALEAKPSSKAAAAGLSSEEAALFERLRVVRRELASERGVPPYVIFHDSVLCAVARQRPTRLSDLAVIAGIGESKRAQFGEAIVDAVRRAVDEGVV
jgi:ATP-dependent DNA helicase RecQ